MCLRKLHVEGDDEGTSDVDVVKVGQTFSFLPHSSSGFGDLVSHYVDLSGRERRSASPLRYEDNFQTLAENPQNLVTVQMHDVHLKAHQRLHQRDGDVGVQVVSSALKHRMSGGEKAISHHSVRLKPHLLFSLKKRRFILQHFDAEPQISGLAVDVRFT